MTANASVRATSLEETEAQFQAAVIELAERHGWLVAHFADSRRQVRDRRTGEVRLVGDQQAEGFPDLVLVRSGQVIFAELKRDAGKTTPAQERWLFELSAVEESERERVRARLWRPADWREIERTLSRGWV